MHVQSISSIPRVSPSGHLAYLPGHQGETSSIRVEDAALNHKLTCMKTEVLGLTGLPCDRLEAFTSNPKQAALALNYILSSPRTEGRNLSCNVVC